jgi:putative aminopeptidase FrvX
MTMVAGARTAARASTASRAGVASGVTTDEGSMSRRADGCSTAAASTKVAVIHTPSR